MWILALAPLVAVLIASLVAWHQATRFDRQTESERWSRQTQPDATLGLALAALVAAVAAAMIMQMMLLPRLLQ